MGAAHLGRLLILALKQKDNPLSAGAILALMGVWFVAVAMPGPDLTQILWVATKSRRLSMWTALGIMAGNVVWITASVFGMSALLSAHPAIIAVLQLAGGSYLTWLGYRLLRGVRAQLQAPVAVAVESAVVSAAESAAAPGSAEGPASPSLSDSSSSAPSTSSGSTPRSSGAGAFPAHPTVRWAFQRGALTNLSNPKALLFFSSVLAQFLAPGMGVIWEFVVCALMISTGYLWFCGVAFAVSSHRARKFLDRAGVWIDAAAGVIFLVLGLWMVGEGALGLF